eukprot:364991-Chlamydomonas_euryale.AAC.18
MPGRLRPLGLNAFSVVLVADPLHPTAAALAPLYYEMYASHYPIRMGLSMAIPAVLRRAAKAAAAATAQPKAARRASSGDDDAEDDDEASAAVLWSGMCASEKAARALLMMRSVFGPQMAFSLWVTISKSEIDPRWVSGRGGRRMERTGASCATLGTCAGSSRMWAIWGGMPYECL